MGKDKHTVDTPGQESRTSREGTNGKQEYSSVSDVGILRPAHDSKSRGRDDHENGEIDTTLASLVADEGNEDGYGTGADVWGHTVQLCFRCCPSKIVQNSRLADVNRQNTNVDGFVGLTIVSAIPCTVMLTRKKPTAQM